MIRRTPFEVSAQRRAVNLLVPGEDAVHNLEAVGGVIAAEIVDLVVHERTVHGNARAWAGGAEEPTGRVVRDKAVCQKASGIKEIEAGGQTLEEFYLKIIGDEVTQAGK